MMDRHPRRRGPHSGRGQVAGRGVCGWSRLCRSSRQPRATSAEREPCGTSLYESPIRVEDQRLSMHWRLTRRNSWVMIGGSSQENLTEKSQSGLTARNVFVLQLLGSLSLQ